MVYYIKKTLSIIIITLIVIIVLSNSAPNGTADTEAIIEDIAPQFISASSPPIGVLSLRLYNETGNSLNSIIVTITNITSFDPTIHLAPSTNGSDSGVALYNETNGILGFQWDDTLTTNTTSGWSGGPTSWNMTLGNLSGSTSPLTSSDPGVPNYYIVIRTSSTCLNGAVFNVSIQAGDINTTFGYVPVTAVWSKDITVDTLPPVTDIDILGPQYPGAYTYINSSTEFGLNGSDSGSGVNSTWYRIWNNGAWSEWFPYTIPFNISGSDGATYIEYNSTDNLDQSEALNNITIYLDNTPPLTTLSISEPQIGKAPTIISLLTQFNLTANDFDSGILSVEYRIDEGIWAPYKENFTFTVFGHHNLSYRSIDNIGNIEDIHTLWLFLNTPPTITSTPVLIVKVDDVYRYNINVFDPDNVTSLIFFLVNSPEGMKIDSATGVITWMPTSDQIGEHIVIVKASDGVDFDTQEFTILVKKSESALLISPEIISVLAVSIVVGILGSLVSFTEFGKFKFFALFIPLYTRIKKEEVLEHFTRGEIFGYILANPGEHLNAIKRALDINNGRLVYHLTKLEKTGYIFSKIDRSYKRFYPTKVKLPKRNINELTRIQKDIVDVVDRNPGISQSDIASNLDISRQLVNYHIKILRDAGCIEIKHDEKQTYCFIPKDFKIRK